MSGQEVVETHSRIPVYLADKIEVLFLLTPSPEKKEKESMIGKEAAMALRLSEPAARSSA